ncbi:hypothetical protein E2P81_ATG10597 [Venturia nashicola]|nr:hypothetical protein E2P81_ATG10597 [Venturia nashicola]
MATYEMQPTKGFTDSAAPAPSSPVDADDRVRVDASGMATGTEADAWDMKRMGRSQELRRNFKSLSVLGLATTTMSTWVALLLANAFSLTNGGLAGTVWLYLASWILTFSLGASLAEMASMAPTSGGQYHWVSEFAPPSQSKFLSYIAYSSAVIILSMVSIYHPEYAMQNWHQSLLMIGIGVLGTLMNTYGAKHLPVLEGIVLIVHIFGFFCIIIPLWVLAPKAPASEVFGTFSNFGGWSTVGAACFVGSITATGSFAGSDAAVHLSEETKDASKSVPRMIIFTIVLNGAMGLVFIITYCFCITNLEAVVQSESPFPFMDVFLAGTNSKAATVAMSTIPLILSVCTSLNALAAASRQAWSLARDQALPFSSWFRKVTTIGTPIPLNSIMFSLSILVIIALINIGSSAALNTIIALLTSATSFSYALSISCILQKRLRGEPLPPSRFTLGKFAIPINALAVLYVTVACIASFFPVVNSSAVADMNWSIVMFGGVLLIAGVDYFFRGKKHYIEPVKHLNKI